MKKSPPEFFIDRALGKRIVEELRKAGHVVHAHDDHFQQTALDIEWLPVIGEKGWVLLTKDARIRKNSVEKNVLIQSNVAAFFLTSGNCTGEENLQIILKAMARIERTVKKINRPFIAIILRDSTVEVLWSSDQD